MTTVNDVDALLDRANTAASQGAWEEALEAADRALDLEPNNRLARRLANQAATQRLEELLDAAEAAASSGDWLLSAKQARAALAIDPDNSEALAYRDDAEARVRPRRGAHRRTPVNSTSGLTTNRSTTNPWHIIGWIIIVIFGLSVLVGCSVTFAVLN